MMSQKSKIFAIYTVVALLSLAMIWLFQLIAARMPDAEMPVVSNVGKESPKVFFKVEKDLELVNQTGEQVRFSDIKGKVTVVAEFFAVCPHCAIRNGLELGDLYNHFKDNPDFRIVCISVDPETDKLPQLEAYAEQLNADPKNWWFAAAADKKVTHEFLEQELKFFKIMERRDPIDIASQGLYQHDLGFLLIDRDFNVVGKWPLAEARSEEAAARQPKLYAELKAELYRRIQEELDKE